MASPEQQQRQTTRCWNAAADGISSSASSSSVSFSYLPEDIWCHIHSLLPMRDAARTACLSRAFLGYWRRRPNLTLDCKTLCSNYSKGRTTGGGQFITRIDSILRNHSGTGLRSLSLSLDHFHYDDDDDDDDDDDERIACLPYADTWLQVAVRPGIEELDLQLHKKYVFPWRSIMSDDGVRSSLRSLQLSTCVLRPTPELLVGAGALTSLVSLNLSHVRITGDELECLLSSSSPALEHLHLWCCKEILLLKIPRVLRRLTRLVAFGCRRMQAVENRAPNLSILEIDYMRVVGETHQVKDLDLGHSEGAIRRARVELPSIMPNLETLNISSHEVVDTPMLPSKFLFLKHLSIEICRADCASPPSTYDYFSLVSFMDASPSLQTFFLDLSLEEGTEHESVLIQGSASSTPHLRQLPDGTCPTDRLRSVEVLGFTSAKSLVELTRCLLKSAASSLQLLTLDTLPAGVDRCSAAGGSGDCRPEQHRRPRRKAVIEEASRAVMAVRKYVQGEVPPKAKLTVVGPCARCHCISNN